MNRIKYWLLRKLFDDICLKSECESCRMNEVCYAGGAIITECAENDVFVQARKVWGIESED